jgi:DNA-binding XRE family transcriptional regulator
MKSGKTISENIEKLRNKLGLTQDDLAKKADIKYTTLMKVEGGTVNKPSFRLWQKSPRHWVFQ